MKKDTPQIDDILFRAVDEGHYSMYDDWIPTIIIQHWKVIKTTPCGFWLQQTPQHSKPNGETLNQFHGISTKFFCKEKILWRGIGTRFCSRDTQTALINLFYRGRKEKGISEGRAERATNRINKVLDELYALGGKSKKAAIQIDKFFEKQFKENIRDRPLIGPTDADLIRKKISYELGLKKIVVARDTRKDTRIEYLILSTRYNVLKDNKIIGKDLPTVEEAIKIYNEN